MTRRSGAARAALTADEADAQEGADRPADALVAEAARERTSSGGVVDVAILEPVSGHGGIEYYGFGLAESLARLGLGVELHVCDETTPPPTASFAFAPTYRGVYGTDPAWRRGARWIAGTVRALRSARARGAAVCHLHLFHAGPLQLFDAIAARRLGLRVVATVHDVAALADRRPRPDLARHAFGAADRLIAHNPSTRDEIRRLFPGACPPIDVIPAGAPEETSRDLPTRESARGALGLPRDAQILLSFGHVKQSKGLDGLLHAVAALRRSRPNAILLVAGRAHPEAAAALRERIRGLGLTDACRLLLEFVPHEEVPALFAAADVAVLPYRRAYQSSVLLLAMACGLPAVASDLPGMRDTIVEGETGFLFPAGDDGALAAAIDRALADPARRASIARAARAVVATKHAWSTIGEQTLDCYRAATATGDMRRRG